MESGPRHHLEAPQHYCYDNDNVFIIAIVLLLQCHSSDGRHGNSSLMAVAVTILWLLWLKAQTSSESASFCGGLQLCSLTRWSHRTPCRDMISPAISLDTFASAARTYDFPQLANDSLLCHAGRPDLGDTLGPGSGCAVARGTELADATDRSDSNSAAGMGPSQTDCRDAARCRHSSGCNGCRTSFARRRQGRRCL